MAVDHNTELVLACIGFEAEAAHIFHIEPVLVEITQNTLRRVCEYALMVQAQRLALLEFFYQPGVAVTSGKVESVSPNVLDKYLSVSISELVSPNIPVTCPEKQVGDLSPL